MAPQPQRTQPDPTPAAVALTVRAFPHNAVGPSPQAPRTAPGPTSAPVTLALLADHPQALQTSPHPTAASVALTVGGYPSGSADGPGPHGIQSKQGYRQWAICRRTTLLPNVTCFCFAIFVPYIGFMAISCARLDSHHSLQSVELLCTRYSRLSMHKLF